MLPLSVILASIFNFVFSLAVNLPRFKLFVEESPTAPIKLISVSFVVRETLELSSSRIDNLSGVISWLETTSSPATALIKPFQVSPLFNSILPPVNLTIESVSIVVKTSPFIKLFASIANVPLNTFNVPAVAFNIPFVVNSV